MRVIVTRPEQDGEPFAASLSALGITPILSPVIEIEFQPSTVDLSGVGALAFTSANGVRAFSQSVHKREMASGLRVFAVGEATAKTALASGHYDIETAEGDVGSLAQVIANGKSEGRFEGSVLHIAGSARAGDLAGALASHGVSSRREVLYEARALPTLSPAGQAALLDTPPAEWVSFFSPRSARLFFDQIQNAGLQKRLKAVKAACLSDAVAKSARAGSWRDVHVAANSSSEAMLALFRG